jgi:uncharacterized protein YegL
MAQPQDRRLPVYLLLDTSGSMGGAPIDAVREGVRLLVTQLRSDPQASETVHLSVITFDSDARQVVPLTDVNVFQEPQLEATGTTSLGAALRALCACADAEVVKGTSTKKGDWKPMVFLMTDGEPTDNWESAIADVKKRSWGGFIACGAGSGAKTEPLKKITETVLKLHDIQDLKQFFSWVTASIKTTSHAVQVVPAAGGGAAPAPGVQLPPVPQTITVVP